MAKSGSNKKVANSLVALSSAAVLAVYGAGYARTRAAADRFTLHATERRPHIPVARDSTTPIAHERSARAEGAAVASSPAPELAAAPATDAPAGRTRSWRNRVGLDEAAAPAATNARVTAPAPAVRVDTNAAHADETALSAAAPPSVNAPPAADAPAAPAPDANASTVPSPAPAADAATASSLAKFRDGTYLGWGTSRHGDIQAAVVVEGGRITAARVAQCLTRYSCAWIAAIPPVIVQRQGTTYDYVSGATESSDAFQEAVADALSHAL